MHGTPSILPLHQLQLQGFEKWLKTLGYAESTVYLSVNYMRDFFFYLKKDTTITPEIIGQYYNYLQSRSNKRQPGGLSQNYIAGNINALKRFSKYLQETGKPFFEVPVKTSPDTQTSKTILSHAEIKALYRACSNDMLGIRDRAILGIYYGCGLRRNEGQSLDLSDILLKEKLVYVRKGKGYKERYVPMTEAVKEDLENYIYVAREYLQSFKLHKDQVYLPDRQALFLSMRSKRMHSNSIITRLQKLVKAAGLPGEIGLHTLRHSIATHLLQSGMDLENVSRFLGHKSLESTQIYTHVAAEALAKEGLS